MLLSSGATLTTGTGYFSSGSFFRVPEIISMKVQNARATVTSRGIFSLPTGYTLDIMSMNTDRPMQIATRDPA